MSTVGKVLCRVFGHPWPRKGWWGDALYGRVEGGYTDNIGTRHYRVMRDCDRCGMAYIAARFHGLKDTYHDQ